MEFWDALRRQYGYPVPDRGERLLAEAKLVTLSNGQQAITFDRMLRADECEAIRAAWQRGNLGIKRGE